MTTAAIGDFRCGGPMWLSPESLGSPQFRLVRFFLFLNSIWNLIPTCSILLNPWSCYVGILGLHVTVPSLFYWTITLSLYCTPFLEDLMQWAFCPRSVRLELIMSPISSSQTSPAHVYCFKISWHFRHVLFMIFLILHLDFNYFSPLFWK